MSGPLKDGDVLGGVHLDGEYLIDELPARIPVLKR